MVNKQTNVYQAPKYNPQKVAILAELRQQAGLSQRTEATHFSKLKDYGSVAAWEIGNSKSRVSRRADFINYLLDPLGLRGDSQQFFQVWQQVRVETWEFAFDLPLPPELDLLLKGNLERIRPTNDVSENQPSPNSATWLLAASDLSPQNLPNGGICYHFSLLLLPGR